MTEEQRSFIGRLSNALGREKIPDTPPSFQLPHDVHHSYLKGATTRELTETFIENCKTVGTTIHRSPDREHLNSSIIEAVNEFGGGSILVADDEYFKETGTIDTLKTTFPEVDRWDLSLSREENISKAEKAAIGIAKAEMALAESGTVILFSHLGSGRAVTLLPTYTITIIDTHSIQPRLTQGMSFLQDQALSGLPCSVNFVSGASATADIELVRVQGVHGPLAISYVLVG